MGIGLKHALYERWRWLHHLRWVMRVYACIKPVAPAAWPYMTTYESQLTDELSTKVGITVLVLANWSSISLNVLPSGDLAHWNWQVSVVYIQLSAFQIKYNLNVKEILRSFTPSPGERSIHRLAKRRSVTQIRHTWFWYKTKKRQTFKCDIRELMMVFNGESSKVDHVGACRLTLLREDTEKTGKITSSRIASAIRNFW